MKISRNGFFQPENVFLNLRLNMQYEKLRNTASDLPVPEMKPCDGNSTFSYRGAGVWSLLDYKIK